MGELGTNSAEVSAAEADGSGKQRSWAKALRVAGWIVAVALVMGVVTLAAIPAIVMGDMVNMHVDFSETWTAEQYGLQANRLELMTDDGVEIVAYEVQAQDPKAVVIFLSGIHNPSVTAFFGHASMLFDEGYSSVLVEMRAHGESHGDVIALGFEEYRDVQAAVNYIQSNPAEYGDVPIVVYGLSMGGAVAINATGQIQDIDGLISVSAYSSWEDMFIENMGAPSWVGAVQRPFLSLWAQLKYGVDATDVNPVTEMAKLGNRPALLMHTTGDSQVSYANFERLVAAAPDHVETWVRPGDAHFFVQDEYFLQPWSDVEYATRIVQFLRSNFE